MSSLILGPLTSAASTIEHASISTAIQGDLNNAPVQFRNVVFNAGSLVTNIAGAGSNANGFTNIPAGTYDFAGTIYVVSGTGRVNVILAISVNGVEQIGPRSACDYIRATQGHNSSSAHVVGRLVLGAASNVGMRGIREANAGAVASLANNGQLSLTRIE